MQAEFAPTTWKACWETVVQGRAAYSPSEVTRLFELEHLRFGRLCAGLHRRAPDAEIGYSILIFRLTNAEVKALLDGPPP